MTAYHPRELAGLVLQALEDFPVVVVSGARQTGKTTFLTRDPALRGRETISLDDFATLEAARTNPEGLLAGARHLTIDEAQRAPELLRAIKQSVDRHRRPGRFLLSGSANLALLRGVSESLAGRALYLTLLPFSRRETLKRTAARPVVLDLLDGVEPRTPRGPIPITEEEVLAGGMPSVALHQAKRGSLWFLGYEQTYLERDVRELSQVADLIAFRNLLRLAALRSAQLLNISDLGRDAKLSAATASRYLHLLQTSYILSPLPPFLRSRTTRLVKSPKLMMADSGLAAHLAGVRSLSPLADEPLRGALFETYVAQNLAAILAAHLPEAELMFWNVQGRHEVDFVIALGRSVLGIEVKAASRFHDRDLAGLRAFLAKTPHARAVLAYNGTESVMLEDRLGIVPLGVLLA
jgi:uncharacterized protein